MHVLIHTHTHKLSPVLAQILPFLCVYLSFEQKLLSSRRAAPGVETSSRYASVLAGATWATSTAGPWRSPTTRSTTASP